MKRNLIKGMILISAIALSSCSVNKVASTQKVDDDVYFSRATAAEQPEYVARPEYRQDADDDQYSDEDDYYYYDDYASRINRFSYFSPFGYYDNFYSPYGYGGGFGIGIGLGYGYGGYGYGGLGYGGGFGYGGFGYDGFGYGGFGYSPWGYGYGYSPYSYWGLGYGGSPYWGIYSAYRNNPRPFRGNGVAGGSFGSRTRTGYGNGYNNGLGYNPNRPSRVNGGGTRANGSYDGRSIRAVRTDRAPRTYQPSIERSAPSNSSFGGSRGGGGGSSSGGGGGGGRPSRP